MKNVKRILALVLGLAMVMTVAGCGKKSNDEGNSADATYTYNTYITTSAVQTLNPHEWELTDEYDIMSLTQRGLYDIIYSENEDYEYINEMAAAAPVDVTEQYAGNDKFGVPSDATEGYAYQFKLRENAKWEDGTAINADSYIYSMQQMLDSGMANYRASNYYEGTYAIAGAYNYYFGGTTNYIDVFDTDTEEYADVTGLDLYTSTTMPVAFFGASMEKFATTEGYEDVFKAEDGTDTLAALAALQGDEDWVLVTDEVKAALDAVVDAVNANLDMDFYEEEYLEYCTYAVEMEETSWDSVGLIKDDEYTFTYILSKPVTSEYMVYYGFTNSWLVNEEVYEANKVEAGKVTKTKYGTSVDTYVSYGPYKLVEWQEDKVIKITKNENWYGYSEDEFEGQYQATDITYTTIDEHSTALQLFLQGNLDTVSLNATDLETYATSDYAVFTPTSYTWKISFNTDKEALASRETSGVNKTIITYNEFREALSLALDRAEFCQTVVPACSPAFGLLNNLYVYDVSDFSIYRDTDYAKDILCEVYETEDYDTLTGFNSTKAAELFQAAYDAALAAGDISETDTIKLEFNCTTASESMQKAVNFLNDAFTEGVKGTSLEGRVSVELKEVDDYYAAMAAGTADIIFSAWGGAENDPYSLMQCYVDPTLYNDGEHGFNSELTFTATIDGKEETMSYYNWYVELCEGKWAMAEADIRLEVLAAMEGAILTQYNTIPLYVDRSSQLQSQKVEYITYDFSSAYMESYGGYRFLKFNYTDAEWSEYCAEQNNNLTY